MTVGVVQVEPKPAVRNRSHPSDQLRKPDGIHLIPLTEIRTRRFIEMPACNPDLEIRTHDSPVASVAELAMMDFHNERGNETTRGPAGSGS